ncbi:MAG: Rib/alpha-like domain-containing protein [Peptoniphilus harei]|nr:Rib/alpha-like domain-containing protein [Peptoniphilus harei]MDU4045833.1 Rib/alpha-like domain-containing protein [Peptoniphilus harei]
MKKKMFSLFLVVTLFLTSFNPVFALGSEINENDENSTQEDLPIVTEKVPEDSAKDKYVKILFVPETNLINNVQNYGTIKNENNEEVALRDEVYNGETTKAKAFYALKSAKWSDLINYRENGKKIFLKLWVENKDKNSEDHKFLGWTNNKILIDVLNPDFLGGKELGKFEVSTRTRYDMENPIVFKAYFQSLPYVYTTADHAVPRRDADGYTLYTSNYKHCTFKHSNSKGATFNPTEFQKRYFITNPYNLKNVVFYIRNDIKDRSFGKFKPNINLAKDAMFCYWYRDPKVDTKLTDDYQILHFENFDLDNYFAKLIINGESISKNSVEQRNFPEDICVVNLVKGKGNKDNVFNYGNYLVFKESKISVIENNKPFKLPTFNKSSNLHWYCDGKKIDDIRDITVNKDMTFVARVENDSEKYTINALDLEKNYGSEIKENEIINCITTNYPKNSDAKPIISLEKGQTLPDGKKSGEYNIKIEVKYPDESISKTSVKLTVLKSQAETYREETKTLEVNKDEVLTVEKLKEGITNLPQEVKVDIKEDADTSEVGEKTARLTLTFKDSSSKEVSIKVRVKEVIEGGIIRPIPEIKSADIEKEEVTYSGNINLTDNIKNLPEGSVVEDITDPKIDTRKPGEYSGKVKVTFKDGSSRIVIVPVEVLKSQAETYREETKTLEANKNEVLTVEKLKEGIRNLPREVKVDIKENADTSEAGEKTARLTLTFKDSSSKEVEVKLRVKEIIPVKSDSEKNPPVIPKDLKVVDKNKLSQAEIDEIARKFKLANPQAKDLIVNEKGKVTLIYEDDSKNILDLGNYLTEAPKGNSEKDKDNDSKENKDKKENWDNYYPDYYNYFPDLNNRDDERNTFKVFVSLPEKVKEEKKAYENTSYVFHINDFYYEIIKDGLSRKINMDISPIINNGRTMLPLRKVAEVLGAEVIWNKDTRTAFFIRDGQTASIQIDNNKIILSSGEVIEMEAKPLNIKDRIFVSLVNVAKVFGLNNGNKDDGKDNDIEWDNKTRTVTIYVK